MQPEPVAISVVIPAYKAQFLADALASLDAQTDPDFEVIVADDASPHDLQSLCRSTERRYRLRYVRFDDNLGGRNLVAHWMRAITLASHDWIWLLGDDDELEPRCIEVVRGRLGTEPEWPGLWRVEAIQIDAAGRVIKEPARFPDTLSAFDYVLARCRGEVSSFACEYIFRRRTLVERAGFVPFPLAWCSDDATWVRLAGADGIRTVRSEGARARWRLSSANISGAGGALSQVKTEARIQYLEWLASSEPQAAFRASPDRLQTLRRAGLQWFLESLLATRSVMGWRELLGASGRLARITGLGRLGVALQLLKFRRWALAAAKAGGP